MLSLFNENENQGEKVTLCKCEQQLPCSRLLMQRLFLRGAILLLMNEALSCKKCTQYKPCRLVFFVFFLILQPQKITESVESAPSMCNPGLDLVEEALF